MGVKKLGHAVDNNKNNNSSSNNSKKNSSYKSFYNNSSSSINAFFFLLFCSFVHSFLCFQCSVVVVVVAVQIESKVNRQTNEIIMRRVDTKFCLCEDIQKNSNTLYKYKFMRMYVCPSVSRSVCMYVAQFIF